MERHDILAMMTALELAGMRAAYDEVVAGALKRRHPVQQVIGELLRARRADDRAPARPPTAWARRGSR